MTDGLYPMEEFTPHQETPKVDTGDEIPKEMNIFFRNEASFLPEGKTSFDELTPEELQLLKSRYRFSPFRPGIYQGITGMGPMRG